MFNCLGPRVEFSCALMHHGENKAELLQRREEWGRKSKVVALLFTTFVMLPALSSKVSLTRGDSSPSGLLRLMNDEFKYQGIQKRPHRLAFWRRESVLWTRWVVVWHLRRLLKPGGTSGRWQRWQIEVALFFFPDQGFCQRCRHSPRSLCRQLKIVL